MRGVHKSFVHQHRRDGTSQDASYVQVRFVVDQFSGIL